MVTALRLNQQPKCHIAAVNFKQFDFMKTATMAMCRGCCWRWRTEKASWLRKTGNVERIKERRWKNWWKIHVRSVGWGMVGGCTVVRVVVLLRHKIQTPVPQRYNAQNVCVADSPWETFSENDAYRLATFALPLDRNHKTMDYMHTEHTRRFDTRTIFNIKLVAINSRLRIDFFLYYIIFFPSCLSWLASRDSVTKLY